MTAALTGLDDIGTILAYGLRGKVRVFTLKSSGPLDPRDRRLVTSLEPLISALLIRGFSF
jgi:hypothetical protein